MSTVEIRIPELGNKYKDYRKDILGDSYNWGPAIMANKVRYVAFHHSVTPATGDWKQECDVIANIHVNGNKWGGIGYRFIICSDGTVVYVGDLSHGGSAVKNHNDEIFSACMVGDFTKHLPTDAQIHSAYILQKFLRSLDSYPLLKNRSQEDVVIGHKDAARIWNEPANATACPGASWPDDMKWRILNDFPYTPQPEPPVNPPVEPPTSPCDCAEKDRRIEELSQLVASLQGQLARIIAEKDGECQGKINQYRERVLEAVRNVAI